MPQSSSGLQVGSLLDNRYRIVRELGRGGFGRTYLAEDTYRFQEKCVLKEFAPQVENQHQLERAQSLFDRESKILYELNHSQIPKFYAMLKTNIAGKDALFLVQQYIDGSSYWNLLNEGQTFQEEEIIKLLKEILPVLEYIHSLNLIHRDISPDNLLKRNLDGLPVLIDFGCVKQAANALSALIGIPNGTLIGKLIYAPEEQMRLGHAFPNSDLYALAVTILVLLTGKEPQDLYDSYRATWEWQKYATVSPKLRNVLNKMLAHQPGDRYQSAREILDILEKINNNHSQNLISQMRTVILAPIQKKPKKINNSAPLEVPQINSLAPENSQSFSNISQNNTRFFPRLGPAKILGIGIAIVLLPAILSFAVVQGFLSGNSNDNNKTELTDKEQQKQKEIYQRIKTLNLNEGNFYQEVDELFYAKYPGFKKNKITNTPEHQKYRQEWYEIAEDLLDRKEKEKRI